MLAVYHSRPEDLSRTRQIGARFPSDWGPWGAGSGVVSAGLGATHVATRSAAHHLSRRARMRSHSAALLSRPGSIPSSRRTWANFVGSAKRLSPIICRKAAIPISEPDSGQPAAAHPQGHIDRKRCERRPGLHSPPVVGFLKGLPGAGHRAHGSRFGGGIEHREARHHLIAGSAPGRGFYQA